MQALILKRVRNSQEHQERVLRWVKRLRQRRLDSIQEFYSDWRTLPTSAPLWLWRLSFAFCWQLARIYLWFALLPQRRRRGIVLTLLSSWLVLTASLSCYLLYLLRPAPTTPVQRPAYAALLTNFVQYNGGLTRALPNQQTQTLALTKLVQTNEKMADGWHDSGHIPFANEYDTTPPANTPAWNWARPLQLRLSWQEGSCSTTATCVVHHVEVKDTGEVGHFYGLSSLRESPRIHLSQKSQNQMSVLLSQLPPNTIFSASLAQSNALIASYCDGDEWKVRLFDRHKLPTPVLRLTQLVHVKCAQ